LPVARVVVADLPVPFQLLVVLHLLPVPVLEPVLALHQPVKPVHLLQVKALPAPIRHQDLVALLHRLVVVAVAVLALVLIS
jgi:hypothetical protein